AQRGGEAEGDPDSRERGEMCERRDAPLRRNLPLQRLRIGRALPARGAEIDREERRRAVEQLVPACVGLRRQMMALRIVVVGPELGVMIEMPARELARRDAAR